MRHIVAIAAALGFFIAVSAPTIAAPANQIVDFSAAKKKVDCKDEKNKNNKACKKMDKKTELTVIDLAAAKKKVDCKDEKNKDNKACKKMDKK